MTAAVTMKARGPRSKSAEERRRRAECERHQGNERHDPRLIVTPHAEDGHDDHCHDNKDGCEHGNDHDTHARQVRRDGHKASDVVAVTTPARAGPWGGSTLRRCGSCARGWLCDSHEHARCTPCRARTGSIPLAQQSPSAPGGRAARELTSRTGELWSPDDGQTTNVRVTTASGACCAR
jgi:hypothetical protein